MRNYRHTTYPPASEAEIAAFERKIGVALCDDYKAFLQSDNGIEFEEYFGDVDQWIYKVHRIFGIGEQNGMQDKLDHFFDRRFLPAFYPIGEDGGGNPLVQIAAGSRRGHLAMLDHETFYGGMTGLLEVTNGFYPDDDEEEHRLPFKTLADATPDQILDACFEAGFLSYYPVSLAEYLKNMDELFNRLAAEPKAPVPSEANLEGLYRCVILDGKYQTAEKLSDFYGDRFILNESEELACRCSVTMEDTRPVRAHVKFLGPTGAVLVDSIETIESNNRWIYKTPIKTDGGTPPSGAYSVEISFPNDPALPTLTDLCEIAVGVSPFRFTAAQFAPASDELIAAFEAGLPYRLCDDLKRWLKGPNGVYIQWPYIDLWKQLGAEARTAFNDDIEAIRKNRWEIVIDEITGLQGPWLADIDRGLIESFEKWPGKPHLSILYPVAKNAAGTGFHGYCQLATGSHRGRIVELLTSTWRLDVLSNVQDGKRSEGRGKKIKTFEYPFRTLAEATPDQIIDAWINEGMIRLTDMDFEEFSGCVIAAHEQEFLRLFSKYFGE